MAGPAAVCARRGGVARGRAGAHGVAGGRCRAGVGRFVGVSLPPGR